LTALSGPKQVRPIRRRKLYEEVARGLEEMIRVGDFEPGEELPPERELVELFGVGRPAIREALFSLEKMGLVGIRSGKRAVVTKPTPDLILEELSGVARNLLSNHEGARQFQAARIFFESSLARQAAKHATPVQLQQLEAALARNRRAMGNPEAFESTDVDFHFVLATIPGNPIFSAVHSGLLGWLTDQRRTSYKAHGAEQSAYNAHKRIFEAIRDGDPDLAEAEMSSHLEQVNAYYWQALDGFQAGEIR
jgi:GntR family transcriptional regulator, sialic acid-inducible nan operon repressor